MKLIQYKETSQYIDGLAQECGISSANALMIQVCKVIDISTVNMNELIAAQWCHMVTLN